MHQSALNDPSKIPETAENCFSIILLSPNVILHLHSGYVESKALLYGKRIIQCLKETPKAIKLTTRKLLVRSCSYHSSATLNFALC